MGALLPTLQAEHLREGLTDYLATTFALTDPDAAAPHGSAHSMHSHHGDAAAKHLDPCTSGAMTAVSMLGSGAIRPSAPRW